MIQKNKPFTILAVDDNAYTLRIVEHALKQAGYEVMTAVSGKDAMRVIKEQGLPHLALVDYHMPGGMSGFELCRALHQFSDLPVIMLTAVSDEETIITGLEEHAEDYIVKPFNPGEMVARIARILKRIGDFAYTLHPITKIDERLSIDFINRKALINNKPVSLTPTETKLLYILMRNAGEIVTTEYILRRLWPLEPTAYEDRLHVHMHRLRRKIEDKTNPSYITSERGTGYIFKAYTPSA
ncbi:MAG: response regulator transcription factor [Candidatus Promineifilaceae bacterium]